jgi:ribosomal protein L20A (L18A)
MADIKAWKVVGTVMGANKRTRKVNLSLEFTVRSAAEEFHKLVTQQHPEAMIEIVYTADGRTGV